ncbi:hypothetical protein C7212DRAFT_349013, partial [Tuber magnatum]
DALSRIYEGESDLNPLYIHDYMKETDDISDNTVYEPELRTMEPMHEFSPTSPPYSYTEYPNEAPVPPESPCSITAGNDWGNQCTLRSTPPEELQHSALHYTHCYVDHCPYHQTEIKFTNNHPRQWGKSTPYPLSEGLRPQQQTTGGRPMSAGEGPSTIAQPMPRSYAIPPQLNPVAPAFQMPEPEPVENLTTEAIAAFRMPGPDSPTPIGRVERLESLTNETTVSVMSPTMTEYRRGLYDGLEDNEEDDLPETTGGSEIEDERDNLQTVNEMIGMFRAYMVAAYRTEPIWKKVNENMDSTGDLSSYKVANGMLYAKTRYGEDCLYIPRGPAYGNTTLREYVISKIHNKGHHSVERNLWYTTEYLFWPEM